MYGQVILHRRPDPVSKAAELSFRLGTRRSARCHFLAKSDEGHRERCVGPNRARTLTVRG